MLLIAADLGYVESQFRWLGPNWTYHLLAVSILYFLAAYRFDSRAVLTLALTSFAAWRGAEVGMRFEGHGNPGLTRLNAIGCAPPLSRRGGRVRSASAGSRTSSPSTSRAASSCSSARC